MNECAKRTLAEKDKALNAAYRKLLDSLKSDGTDDTIDFKEARRQLVEAQRAWIRFRDNDCSAMLTVSMNGTIRGVVYLGCLQARTEQRTRELENWLRDTQ